MRLERGRGRMVDFILTTRGTGDWWECSPSQFVRWYIFRYNEWLCGLSMWTKHTRAVATSTELASIPTLIIFVTLALLVLLF